MIEQKFEDTSTLRSPNVIRFPTKVGARVVPSEEEEKKEPEWVQEVTRKLQAARLARLAKHREDSPPSIEARPVNHSNEELRKKIVASLSFTPPPEKVLGTEKPEQDPPGKIPLAETALAPPSPPGPLVANPDSTAAQKPVTSPVPPVSLLHLDPDPPVVVPLDLDEVLHLQEDDFAPAIPAKHHGPDRSILLSRILAGLVDFVIVLICSTPFFFTLNYLSAYEEINRFTLFILAGIAILIYHLYSLFFLCFSGQTIGMMIAELQVVNSHGDLPGHHQAIGRTFFFLLSFFALGLGLGWSLFDQRCRCFQDILSATEIVRVREPLRS
jgi:uncharacterized RDD family membrane protein YckC